MRETKKSIMRRRGLAIFLLWPLFLGAAPAGPVRRYERFLAAGRLIQDGSARIILRKFLLLDEPYYLMVDPATLGTAVRPADDVRITDENWAAISRVFSTAPYLKALRDAGLNSAKIQDAGITHLYLARPGVDLTVDLCPSHLPLERVLFNDLIQEFAKTEKPVPVAVSLTGVWMERHVHDLLWLRGLAERGDLAVTWINHSYHHQTSKKLPLVKNFLLEKGVDLEAEVLQTEAKMIECRLTPSVFFRFPGLVSDEAVFRRVLALGLVPVGSDAWLGKNQWPKDGSIVLVHGNGNEPIGIRRFLKLLRTERPNILGKHWQLYDLRESLAGMEKTR